MADVPSYVVMGQVFITNGTGVITEAGRQATDGATVLHVTTEGTFTFYMANGTACVIANVGDGAAITGSPKTLAAGANAVTITGTGTITLTLTIGTTANNNSVNTYSLASGGACGASVPISSNSCLLDANSFTKVGQSFNFAAGLICMHLNWTGALYNPALAGGASIQITIWGSLTTIAAMTWTKTAYFLVFYGSGGNITTNGCSISDTIQIGSAIPTSGSRTMVDNTTCGGIYLAYGLLTVAAGVTINTGAVTITTDAQGKTLTLGAGVIINCTSWTWGTNGTLTTNTATINVSGTGAFAGGGITTYYIVNLKGTAHTITGNNTFAQLNFNPTGAQTITYTDGSTQTYGAMTRAGTGVITEQGSGVAGYNLVKTGSGLVVLSKMSVSRATVTPANKHYYRNQSVDGGNNTGITFNEPPPTIVPKLFRAG